MLRPRDLVVGFMVLVAGVAWRVHQGMVLGQAKKVFILTFIGMSLVIARGWLRDADKPRPLPSADFPWGLWVKGHVMGVVFMGLQVMQGYGTADLIVFAIIVFGVGNLVTIAFWLWDRQTLRGLGVPPG